MFARGVAEAAVFCAVVMIAQRFLAVGAAWAWVLAVVLAVLTTRLVTVARARRLGPPPG